MTDAFGTVSHRRDRLMTKTKQAAVSRLRPFYIPRTKRNAGARTLPLGPFEDVRYLERLVNT